MHPNYLEQLRKVNKKLAQYGEYIPEDMLCARAYLQGVLDRLVYDEGRMSQEEALSVEALLSNVKDPFEARYNLSGNGR